ncbi:hypothetical protein GQ55_2G465500 [Panicum hallii var. hallii]|uniref:Uncharacterized protein n=1 Tax=Panicum hallii var. hallii TaxID=1504633 RepID=A0A2T7EZS1_9POAL|nr:hypothetical protein GQ55_2G465500 [Panicum hallii var. hallii]
MVAGQIAAYLSSRGRRTAAGSGYGRSRRGVPPGAPHLVAAGATASSGGRPTRCSVARLGRRRGNSWNWRRTNLDVARAAADGVVGVRGEDAAGDERRPEHRPGIQDRERAQGRCRPHRSSELCVASSGPGNRSRGRFRTN